ncbi:MAG: VWA domain-containing protein [Caldilinea sp.]|nr:VWA domain-containing protein [Caldilinea sp.]MCB0148620.1 VWA domain-containing protein [Caldilineaceae bacterium]MCB9140664.1 VWA domain-containing protein [Anaerolineales bacterium]MCB0038032.1 VWA domain-containing protein [Caldilinea sp.]MCB0049988.1 VWA domain-containing protein [Caldilinea sp.]
MKQMALRTTLLTGLGIFAVLWTLLMGIGVSGVSPAAGGARKDAAQFGTGAHIMYVDESNFPEVTVYLAVNDDAGQPILGLEQADFTLREDGKPVDITAFVGAGGGATSTVLVIDQSGSMGDDDKMSGAIRAAQGYMDFLNVGRDRLGIIVFSDWSLPLAPLDVVTDSGRAVLRGLLGALFPLAGTEFYAATIEGVKQLEGVSGRRVVLALTDGRDNSGQARLQQAIDAALAANTPIYVVGLGSDVDRDGLQRLATATNGQVYFSPNAAELEQLYAAIASNLRNEYALTYHSLTPNLDGTRRDLAVDIGAAGGNISASGGYAVGGILAPSLSLAVFLPTLLVLLAVLIGLIFVPGVTRPRIRRQRTGELAETPHQTAETDFTPAQEAPPVIIAPPRDEPPPAPLTCVVTMPLAAESTTLGSAPHNTWVINGVGVAAQQARITLSNNRYVVADLTGLSATQVSYNGSPEQLRPIQQNALRDGSRIVMGDLALTFRQTPVGAALERRLPLTASGLCIGAALDADVSVSSPQPLAIRIRHDGRHWLVECEAGQCQVSYSGDPAQLRPVTQRNALQPASLVQVGALTLRIEAA